MKAVILLSISLLLVSTKSIPIKKIQLKEIHDELSKRDPKIFTHDFVPDVIIYNNCTKEDVCKAWNITSEVLGPTANISRLFRAYAEETHCTLKHNGKRLQMKEFLERMTRCVEKIYSERH
ncbi:hypothetical protein COCON_G00048030 [Conger conger]|uniref:Uncharacterized protein n=1 Tax=Conger conger TaxID=82655 RepID=A0A9Q1I4I6_CONCO|nr:hypothetical protein COCON_G00048030 [Conger conger]